MNTIEKITIETKIEELHKEARDLVEEREKIAERRDSLNNRLQQIYGALSVLKPLIEEQSEKNS